MNVCLFVCSLWLWAQYVPVQPNFPGIPLSSRRKSWATFFPAIVSLSPQTPLFATNGIAVFLGMFEDKPSSIFKDGEPEFGLHLSEIVLVKLEPISDKQFNPFRPAIRKIPYPPTRKCCNMAISGWKGLYSLSGPKDCGSALSL